MKDAEKEELHKTHYAYQKLCWGDISLQSLVYTLWDYLGDISDALTSYAAQVVSLFLSNDACELYD